MLYEYIQLCLDVENDFFHLRKDVMLDQVPESSLQGQTAPDSLAKINVSIYRV